MESLKDYFASVEAQLSVLEATEPTALENECSVASVAPVKGGMVGLDLETGRPMQVGWKYKTIDEKPVIINAGATQTIIPPKPPPPPIQLPAVTSVEAGALYEAMTASKGDFLTEADVQTKSIFVRGCLANPAFFLKWQARYAVMEAAAKFVPGPEPEPLLADWPAPCRTRQRIVDT